MSGTGERSEVGIQGEGDLEELAEGLPDQLWRCRSASVHPRGTRRYAIGFRDLGLDVVALTPDAIRKRN